MADHTRVCTSVHSLSFTCMGPLLRRKHSWLAPGQSMSRPLAGLDVSDTIGFKDVVSKLRKQSGPLARSLYHEYWAFALLTVLSTRQPAAHPARVAVNLFRRAGPCVGRERTPTAQVRIQPVGRCAIDTWRFQPPSTIIRPEGPRCICPGQKHQCEV